MDTENDSTEDVTIPDEFDATEADESAPADTEDVTIPDEFDATEADESAPADMSPIEAVDIANRQGNK